MENVRVIPMEDVEKKPFEGKNFDIVICQKLYGREKAIGLARYLSFVKKGDVVTDEAGDYYVAVEDSIRSSTYLTDSRDLLTALLQQGIIDVFEVDNIFLKDKKEASDE